MESGNRKVTPLPGSRRAVFLDRDGVLNAAIVRNGKPYPPASRAELVITDGAAEDLAALRSQGFLLIVVTNQPDIARGTQTRENVVEIHQALREALPLDDIISCFHDDSANCACRKPKPGMLLDAAAKHHIDLSRSFLIGDRWRDIDAGAAAGCRTVLLDRGYDERPPENAPSVRVRSLTEAVIWIRGF